MKDLFHFFYISSSPTYYIILLQSNMQYFMPVRSHKQKKLMLLPCEHALSHQPDNENSLLMLMKDILYIYTPSVLTIF